MKLRTQLLICTCLAGTCAYSTDINYSFTVDPGLASISNVYIADDETSEKYGFLTPLAGTFTPAGGTYSEDLHINGSVTGPQYLFMICEFTDLSGVSNVALSLPSQTFTDYLGQSWTSFDTSANFLGSQKLPDEPTTLTDLQAGGSALFPITQTFTYLMVGAPVLNTPNTLGELGAFDGEIAGGTFEYGLPSPEPTTLAVGGLLLVLLKRRSRKSA